MRTRIFAIPTDLKWAVAQFKSPRFLSESAEHSLLDLTFCRIRWMCVGPLLMYPIEISYGKNAQACLLQNAKPVLSLPSVSTVIPRRGYSTPDFVLSSTRYFYAASEESALLSTHTPSMPTRELGYLIRRYNTRTHPHPGPSRRTPPHRRTIPPSWLARKCTSTILLMVVGFSLCCLNLVVLRQKNNTESAHSRTK